MDSSYIQLAQYSTQLAQQQVQAAVGVRVLKSAATLQQVEALRLIQSANVPTPRPSAPGVGTRIDISA